MKKYLLGVSILFYIILATSLLSVNAYDHRIQPSLISNANDLIDYHTFRNTSYIRVYNKWVEEGYSPVQLKEPILVTIEDFENQNAHLTFNYAEGYQKGKVALLNKGESLTVEVNVPETGLYEIELDYFVINEFTSQPKIILLVNNEMQFNEMGDLSLEVQWAIEPRPEEERYNRYGNEILPYSNPVLKWYNHTLDDSTSRFSEPFKFLLTKGKNTLVLTAKNQSLYVGNLTINNSRELQTYADYYEPHLPSQSIGERITIQGEDFKYKNDLEIKSSFYKEPAMTPYEYKHTVLNRLDGESMSRGGTKVTYHFEVEKNGYYQITFKALKNSLKGLTSVKRIYIDGEIPFKELSEYHFDYNRKWVNHTLGQDDEPFLFYFEKGHHTLTIETTLAHITPYIDRLHAIMDEINHIGLMVKSITGGSKNEFIDWDLVKYLPSLKDDLLRCADELETIYEEISRFSQTKKRAPEISTLVVAADQLRRLARDPNKISNKLMELTDGSGSAYQLIGNAISILSNQPLDIDAIYIHNTSQLPKPNASWFTRFIDTIKSFFYSFFDERYKYDTVKNDQTLEVWVGKSNIYLDIIQSMVDSQFTKETGIEVQLKILPNIQKIVLSNATKTNPDVVLSIDSWEPYNYALRGMLTDLSQFDDFAQVVADYHPNNFTPLIYEDGVYGIPETQSFYFLFYRKDILDFLGITPPDTWEEVIHILPILQSHQMNFFHPLGGEGAYKGYGLTSPLIYQFGGEIYTPNGMSTVLNDEDTVKGIKFMTDLFNIYNLPLQVPNFFEHFRSGSLPVGIHTHDLYLTLKYAAPELAGQWGMLPMPGNDYNEDGIVERWAPTYGTASIIFKNSKLQDEAWEFVKWWNSAEVQIEYLKHIKMNLGERFMSMPANLKALENSVWDEEIIEVGLEQAKWARIPAVTPGSYIVERELTNIFNKVVIDKKNVRVAIDESIPRINRELARKFEEFNYLKNGKIVKEYIVPNHSNIHRWIPPKKEEINNER